MLRKALDRDMAIEMAAERVLIACYKWWPDVVLCVSCFFTPEYLLDMMRMRGHTIVLVHTESPYQDDEQLVRAKHATINLLNDPVNIAAYQALGVPAAYMPHAYRPDMHCPGPADERLLCDFSFVGTGYPSRMAFFEAMDLAGIETILGGNWLWLKEDSPLLPLLATEKDECLDNQQAIDLYRSSKAGINVYRREAEDQHSGEGWAMGPREVEMAATGLFYLREPRGEGDQILPMLPTFTGPQEASDVLRWYLKHGEERTQAAAAARQAVHDRTFDRNARSLLQMLDQL
jgi:hypothetical protein